MLPVGLYEEEGRLVAGFGEPFALRVPRHVPKDARDAWATDRVMNAIKDLIPESLWGVYKGSD
jgi:hypothetical protein